MRKSTTMSWKELLQEAKQLRTRELVNLRNALETYCQELMAEQEEALALFRSGKVKEGPVAEARPSRAKKASRGSRKRTVRKSAKRSVKKKSPGKPGAPARRGKAGTREVTQSLLRALRAGPLTIPELVKKTKCVRVTADKYIKQWLKEKKVKKAGTRNRATLYALAK